MRFTSPQFSPVFIFPSNWFTSPPVISTLFASPFFTSSFYTRPRFKSLCISSPVQPNLSSNHKPGDGVISALPEGFAICDIVTRDDFLEQYEDILTVPKGFLFYRDKFIFWNMEDLQPISDAEKAAFSVGLAK